MSDPAKPAVSPDATVAVIFTELASETPFVVAAAAQVETVVSVPATIRFSVPAVQATVGAARSSTGKIVLQTATVVDWAEQVNGLAVVADAVSAQLQ
jgi:hypothetical protein